MTREAGAGPSTLRALDGDSYGDRVRSAWAEGTNTMRERGI
jgi:hypothetical protein